MRTIVCALLCLGCLMVGCTRTPDTTWYILQSNAVQPSLTQLKGARVQLRKVDIPAYLDRNAIVTREGGVRLRLAEYDAWAEPLGSGMQRALADCLAPLLQEQNVLLQALDDDSTGPLQLFVQVQRFDGTLGAEATLDARWSLRNTDDRALARGSFHASEGAGDTYESLVRAQSHLVERLGRDIADPVAEAAKKSAH